MARYLKSLKTGVILPYVEAALKSAGVREATAEEAAEHEASLGIGQSVPAVEPEPAPEPVEVVEVETGTVVTQDFADGEPDADSVLEALRVD